MKFDPQIHHRRSIRLPGYDYSQAGAYFITLCSWQRAFLFGEVVDGEMKLTVLGKIVTAEWQRLAVRFPFLQLGEWVVMPNHFHGILIIGESDGTGTGGISDGLYPAGERESADNFPRALTAPNPSAREQFGAPVAGSIPTIIRSFKASVTCMARSEGTVWQRNYYEHIIRNEAEMQRITDYIQHNPLRWQEDQLHPAAVPNQR